MIQAPVETIRVSQQAKERLIRLKRWTGLKNWNVICRWAVAASLAESSPPPHAHLPSDSNIEMSWRTFAGPYHEVFAALIAERCRQDGLGDAPDVLAAQFRLHLHRGLEYLAADRALRSIGDLCRRTQARPT